MLYVVCCVKTLQRTKVNWTQESADVLGEAKSPVE